MTALPDERTYYGRPILKQSVWTWEIPAYFFCGGLAGAASTIALAAESCGRGELARVARRVAAGAVVPAPALLVHDLGRPSRFYNMLRVAKPSSPMSVGTWTLTVYAPAAVGAAVLERLGWAAGLRRAAGVVAGVLGPVMATYTGVLVANTAVPVWQAARRELPALFAASAVAAGAAATTTATAADVGAPVRRLAVAGAVTEVAVDQWMRRRLGPLGEAYAAGTAHTLQTAATVCSGAGAVALALDGRRTGVRRAGAAAILAGSALQRFAVMAAGRRSVADPLHVIRSQRNQG